MPSILTSRHAAHPDSGRVHAVPSEITPQAVYASRRQWLREAALLGGGVLLLDGMIKNNASAGGKRYTVAGRQYAPQGYDGHFVAFRDAKAREDIARFLVTGLLADAPVLGK